MIGHATTTITVLRVPEDLNRDPYDPEPDPVEVAAGVRAHIGSPSGGERVSGGEQSRTDLRLTCDPTDLRHTDQVRDDTTGETFETVWVKQRTGLGLDHVTAFLQHIEGAV